MKRSGKSKNKGSAAPSNQSDEPLPLPSLRLVAPPLRLVSAAVWKVMQQRDVLLYGRLEEFVTSISETVPGLLHYRHQAKLTVGLRARLVLELLRDSSPDSEIILSQLESLQVPKPPANKRKDLKVETSVKNFHTLVHTLLEDPEERILFFQEQFDSQYGPQYESALEKLLWEFLTRLDQLLPVPDLAQTVSWLCTSPAVLEDCARSVCQPQLLRTLLHHERCLGHLDSAASIPASTGDSILSSLSIPPSGRVMDTNQPGPAPTSSLNKISSSTESRQETDRKQTKELVSQIAPVFGSICSEDLPKRTTERQNIVHVSERENEELEAISLAPSKVRTRSNHNIVTEEEHFIEKVLVTAVKPTPTSSEAEEDQADVSVRAVKRSKRQRPTNVTEKQGTRRSTRRSNGNVNSKKEETKYKSETSKTTAQCIKLQEEEDLPDVTGFCKKHQLRVVIPKLDIRDVNQTVLLKNADSDDLASTLPNQAIDGVLGVINSSSLSRKRKLSDTSTPKRNLIDTVDSQICDGSPCIPVMPGRMESSEKFSPVTGEVIVDSEDEATENVKVKLFTKRYCKTKNNTYIPTLHEFWSPAFLRRDLVAPGNGCR